MIYGISDLHLPGSDEKTMDMFGPQWESHFEKIKADWRGRVGDEDVVLIPGDISWAMYLAKALPDLEAIAALPGTKILLRGNHDYWWSSISKVRAALGPSAKAIQNDSVTVGGVTFCGSRGWACPGAADFKEPDKKLYERELIRLELSLRSAKADTPILGMLHYPPFNERQEPSGFTRLFEAYGVSHVVYGHLHGGSLSHAFHGLYNGVSYHQISCDRLGFKLYALPEIHNKHRAT